MSRLINGLINALCGIFVGKSCQIKKVARRLCLNITLSMHNGDKFYSFDEDNDFLAPFPSCALQMCKDDIINSDYFKNFVSQTGIIVRKYKGKFMIDYRY